MAKFSVCKYQSYQRKVDDNYDMPPVFCKKIKDFCVAQKHCPELNKYVVNERPTVVCRWFEDGLKNKL